jgi:hypothetical protein
MWGRARLGTGSVDRFGDPRASSEHILFLPARPDNQFASDADLDSGRAIYRSLQASAPYGACGQSVVVRDVNGDGKLDVVAGCGSSVQQQRGGICPPLFYGFLATNRSTSVSRRS